MSLLVYDPALVIRMAQPGWGPLCCDIQSAGNRLTLLFWAGAHDDCFTYQSPFHPDPPCGYDGATDLTALFDNLRSPVNPRLCCNSYSRAGQLSMGELAKVITCKRLVGIIQIGA